MSFQKLMQYNIMNRISVNVVPGMMQLFIRISILYLRFVHLNPTPFKTMLYLQCNKKKGELTAASKPYPLMAKDISFALAELSSIISLNLVTKNCDRNKNGIK